MTEKIKKLIESAKNKETNVLPEHKDFWNDTNLLVRLQKSLNKETSDTNLADTKLAAISRDAEIEDKEYFNQRFKETGTKNKKEYVRFVLRRKQQ